VLSWTAAIVRLFGVNESPEVAPHYNIAPTQFVAVVRAGQEQSRRLSMLYWGLVPYWAGEKSIGARMINARAETLNDKPAFRNAYRTRRCLVLADGYYEWQRSQSVKQPHFIHFASGEPFGMAGLWETWRDPANGERLESCTIVTTTPAAHLYDRMPVVPPAAHAEWLDPGNQDTRRLARLLAPFPSAALASHAVGLRVNSARNDEPDIVLAAGGE